MEQLMLDLLEATRSKPSDTLLPPYARPTFSTSDFIHQEDFRSEPSLFTNDDSSRYGFSDEPTRLSETSVSGIDSQPSLSAELTDSDVSSASFSYISYVDQSLYRTPSPPTYVPGDYHDISLPDALSVSSRIGFSPSSDSVVPAPNKVLSFSIDSLLGDVLPARDESVESAFANVVSHASAFYPPTQPEVVDPLPTLNQYQEPLQQLNDLQRQPAYSYEMFAEVKSSQTSAVASTLFWCHACARFCSSADSAEKHKATHALMGDKCSLRKAIFRQHSYVTVHENTGFLDRVKCGLCNKIVCGRFFAKHLRAHNGHQCEMCSKEFSSKSRLNDHKNEHTGELPYACTECPRRFGSRVGLSQHVRRHRNFRCFGCRFCEKRFSSKDACAVHERIHTGNNPYKCHAQECGRSFPQKVQLNIHMLTHL